MVIERAFADADLGRDGIDAHRPNAPAIEQPVGSFENALLHRRSCGLRHSQGTHVLSPLDTSGGFHTNYTDLCNQVVPAGNRGRTRNPRTKTMPLLQALRPTLPILIGASLMLS